VFLVFISVRVTFFSYRSVDRREKNSKNRDKKLPKTEDKKKKIEHGNFYHQKGNAISNHQSVQLLTATFGNWLMTQITFKTAYPKHQDLAITLGYTFIKFLIFFLLNICFTSTDIKY